VVVPQLGVDTGGQQFAVAHDERAERQLPDLGVVRRQLDGAPQQRDLEIAGGCGRAVVRVGHAVTLSAYVAARGTAVSDLRSPCARMVGARPTPRRAQASPGGGPGGGPGGNGISASTGISARSS